MKIRALKQSLIGLAVFMLLALIAGTVAPVVRAAPSRALPANFKIVAYLTSWSGSASSVQYSRITHLNYAFVLPNANGSLQALDNPAKLQDAVSRAHAAGVKVLISVGGWNDGNDSAFESLAGNSTARNAFINNMVNMVNTYNLDGVDIDWEYPDPGTSATNYAVMMRDLGTAMHTRGKLLTAAVVSGGTTAGGVLTEVFGYVDFLNIMTYDGGSPHANYDWAVSNVNAWMSRGLPAAKTVMGVPFYASPGGFSYAQAAAAGFQNQDCATVNGTYGCYNGIPTIQRKTQFMLDKGGIMFWEISQDATGSASLVTTIFNAADQGDITPVPTTPVPSGPNLALNRPASSSSNETAAYTPNLAVDGNTGTRWSSLFSDPQWIQVDLGAAYNINRVILNWEAAYGSGYQIQVSGSATGPWTTIYSTTTGNGGIDDLTGLSGSGRYIRMNGTVRATAWGYSLFEFQVFGTDGPVVTPTITPTPTSTGVPSSNLALNRPASASSTESTLYPAGSAVDGNTGTRWSSLFSDPQWIQVDLGAAYNINRVVLNWEAAYGSAYQIQVSDSATGPWTTIYSTTTGNGATDDLTGLSGSGRYIRMNGTVRATAWGYSLFEFQVFGTAVTGGVLPRTGWTATGSSTGAGETPGNALDGNAATRWSTGAAQANGQWFRVDMAAVRTFNRIVLDAGASAGDYPRGYQVFVSNDGTNWGSAIASGTGSTQSISITFASQSARYIRIVQTGSVGNWWSIHELNVYN